MLDLTRLFGRDQNTMELSAGEIIFREGDECSEMYVVLDGQVDIIIGEKIVETVDPGGLFGEMALLGPAPRSATAVARFDATLVAVDNRGFLLKIQQTPYFAIQVMGVLADRLRRMPPAPDMPDYVETGSER